VVQIEPRERKIEILTQLVHHGCVQLIYSVVHMHSSIPATHKLKHVLILLAIGV